ncbi:MAG: hypothetical protein PHV34_18190 [Verrucomicrobiae bacterium]|nr:hypothetical protein [Verrucomicrobiae bacterium]
MRTCLEIILFCLLTCTLCAGGETHPSIVPPAPEKDLPQPGTTSPGHLHAPAIPAPASWTGGETDAFGIPSTGCPGRTAENKTPLPEEPVVHLRDVAAHLVVQGFQPGREVILNSVVLPVGAGFSIMHEKKSYRLFVQAVSEKELTLGWSLNQETTQTPFPLLEAGSDEDAAVPLNTLNETEPVFAPVAPRGANAVVARSNK